MPTKVITVFKLGSRNFWCHCSLVALLCSSCTLQGGAPATAPSGFLTSGAVAADPIYQQLTVDPKNGGLVWRASDFDLSAYGKLIIPRVAIWLTPAAEERGMDPQLLHGLASYFRDRLVSAVQDRYPVIQTPEPGTLILNVAITDVNLAGSSGQPDWASAAADKLIGSAAIEAEVLDAVSGKRLAAFMETRQGKLTATSSGNIFAKKPVLDRWAELVRRRLDESRKH